ncbi:MAG: phosphoglucosamine mutase [Actinomycetota bacterium]
MQFGTDGVRGRAHDELTVEFAARLARAASRVLGATFPRDPVVVIGADTRESSPEFVAALTAGFGAEGVAVRDLGVVPTPLVAFECARTGAMGAMVSASHNPWHDNGIKLFARGGTKLPDDIESAIEARLADVEPVDDTVDAVRRGVVASDLERATAAYAAHVAAVIGGRRLDGLRVVLDTSNGAACSTAPDVLRSLGAEVVVVADEPDGRNINDGCGATEPSFVAAHVAEHGADVGIALDGDADRLIAVGHDGVVVDGDHVIAICAIDLRSRGALVDDTVVVTVMTNLGFRLAMREAGVNVVETAVGDRYVLEALDAGGYSLGGEQSGHVIFREHATTGDGLLTAVSLLDVIARSNRPLADLAADAMTSLPQVLVNVRIADRVPDVADRLAGEIARVEAGLDGAGRVLVRASGTEPLIRVMVEATTLDRAQRAADELADHAQLRFG